MPLGHLERPARMVRKGNRRADEHEHAVPRLILDRAAEPGGCGTDRIVVLAQDRDDPARRRRLGKGREPPQIAAHDGQLQGLFLGRAFQPAHPNELRDLRRKGNAT
jgi:hypothetical protein